MAVIIQFPTHARMFAEPAVKEDAAGAVVLPFMRVRKVKARDRTAGSAVAEGQRTACVVSVSVTAARTD